jgi:hypothetical protein
MKRRYLVAGLATAVLSVGTYVGTSYALASQPTPLPSACVQHGVQHSILGNYMLWNWNNSTYCPYNTYPVWFSNRTTIINPTATVTAKPSVTPTITVTPTVTVTATQTVTPTPTTTTPAP